LIIIFYTGYFGFVVWGNEKFFAMAHPVIVERATPARFLPFVSWMNCARFPEKLRHYARIRRIFPA
jgi:hypothetical protein